MVGEGGVELACAMFTKGSIELPRNFKMSCLLIAQMTLFANICKENLSFQNIT